MNLLFRFAKFILRTTFVILLRIAVILFRLLLPYLVALLRLLRTLISFSLSATVNGPRRYTDRLASEWTRRLLDRGASPYYIDQLYSFCRVLVASLIILGWAVAALFTVAILRVVFGFFT